MCWQPLSASALRLQVQEAKEELEFWEESLAKRADSGPFFMGSQVSLVDFAVFPFLVLLRDVRIQLHSRFRRFPV